MPSESSHYLLFAEASTDSPRVADARGQWRFVLETIDSQSKFAASDEEPTTCQERLELLAVVRGLESLDGPARVTLVTKSRYVSRGLKRGLAEWRRNGWRWERFGTLAPVRDADLWQRVDRALKFHEVECRLWKFSAGLDSLEADQPAAEATPERSVSAKTAGRPAAASTSFPRRPKGLVATARRRLGRAAAATLAAGSGTALAGA
ncbi:hypothetical protein OAS39_00290 [Pirellulales bacterium]|nr:hypothetical protein [Pirellulales bacterium]